MRFNIALAKAHRLWTYRRGAIRRPRQALRFVFRDRETTNFSYDLGNADEIGALFGVLTRTAHGTVATYMQELETDERTRRELERKVARRANRNNVVQYGARALWYSLVRIYAPLTVVETGVYDGLGSAVLAAAVARNGKGQVFGLDISSESAWLVEQGAPYTRVVGDIRDTLPSIAAQVHDGVEMLVQDSFHTVEHEWFEFQTALRHRGRFLIIVANNTKRTTTLREFIQKAGGRYAEIAEDPKDHFYPGNLISVGILEGDDRDSGRIE